MCRERDAIEIRLSACSVVIHCRQHEFHRTLSHPVGRAANVEVLDNDGEDAIGPLQPSPMTDPSELTVWKCQSCAVHRPIAVEATTNSGPAPDSSRNLR